MDRIDLNKDDFNTASPVVVNMRLVASAVEITKPTEVIMPDGTVKGIETSGYFLVKYQDGGYEILSEREFAKFYEV